MDESEEEGLRRMFASHGEKQIRLMMNTGNWNTNWTSLALTWLKEQDQEAERRAAEIAELRASYDERALAASERAAAEASRQADIAERALRTAKTANNIAMISTVVAAVAMIISVLALLHSNM